jgi:hypothetical protein
MAKKEDIQEAGKGAAGGQVPEKPAGQTAPIETVEDLEACYPRLVTEIRDEVIGQVSRCTGKQVKENMPELYERIVTELQGRGGPNLNVPGFLLEIDDPFAKGTLEQYEIKKGLAGLSLPYVLPFKVKGQSTVNAARLTEKYEDSEALQAEFKTVDAYIAFKSRIIVQVLEFYILVAEGGGDYVRAEAARKAMKKIK